MGWMTANFSCGLIELSVEHDTNMRIVAMLKTNVLWIIVLRFEK
jgi:hypothetical protein